MEGSHEFKQGTRSIPRGGLLPAARDIEALVRAEHPDPFAILGPHDDGAGGQFIRAFLPGALSVEVLARDTGELLGRLGETEVPGLYAGRFETPQPYRLRIHWAGGEQVCEDPYSFGPLLGEMDLYLFAEQRTKAVGVFTHLMDLYLFAEGNHRDLSACFGAQVTQVEGIDGVRFAVWAPNARRVSVVGDFNGWDGRRHPMRLRHPSGVWEIFIPRLQPGESYKYEILGAHSILPLKSDPVALATQLPPDTASRVAEPLRVDWHDQEWMQSRAERQRANAPLSIYELHAGSWQCETDEAGEVSRHYGWGELAERLIPYVQQLGFTHIELMPIMEHPFGGSWGYQPLSQFAPSARYGTPQAFAGFVDACHRAGIGVILDWVPAHFPTDAHGLAQFDGTALYEYGNPLEGFHQDWDTLIYNLGRTEVHGFMLASALHWLKHFHIDGLRVDAVASMLYRDYSRKAGEWVPNRHGGRENLEAIDFLRHLNDGLAGRQPEHRAGRPGVRLQVEHGLDA